MVSEIYQLHRYSRDAHIFLTYTRTSRTGVIRFEAYQLLVRIYTRFNLLLKTGIRRTKMRDYYELVYRSFFHGQYTPITNKIILCLSITFPWNVPDVINWCIRYKTSKIKKKTVSFIPNATMSFVCDICGNSFSNKFNLTRHIQTVHDCKKFQCKFCKKDLSRKEHLRRHESRCGSGYCKFCDTFPEQPLYEHIQDFHKDKTFQCSKCNKKFTNKRNFNQHKCEVRKFYINLSNKS